MLLYNKRFVDDPELHECLEGYSCIVVVAVPEVDKTNYLHCLKT